MNARSNCLLYRGKIGEHEVDAVLWLMLFCCWCCFGFRLRKSAASAGDIGVSSVWID